MEVTRSLFSHANQLRLTLRSNVDYDGLRSEINSAVGFFRRSIHILSAIAIVMSPGKAVE